MIEPAEPGSVIVGVDGSESSFEAVEWAAREAQRRDTSLTIVHAWQFPLYHVPLDAPASAPPEAGLRGAAERILHDAERQARTYAPELPVRALLVDGGASAAVLGVSRHAALVVLGSRGLGGVTGLLVGSVGVQVCAHATCPVIVIRRPETGGGAHVGKIVVGVDGSGVSRTALAFAFDEAHRLGIPLVVVTVVAPPTSLGVDGAVMMGPSVEDLTEGAEGMVADALAPFADRYPDVATETSVSVSSSGWALVGEAAGCELLVVGSRGHGGFAGLLLGSVSQYALHHARCPVAVVRLLPGDDGIS